MTTKVALLRDVAKLLKKYKPADLSDAVSSLSKRKQRKKQPKSKSRATSKRTKKAGVTKSLRSSKARPLARTKRPASTPTKSRKRNQEAKGATRSRRVKTHVAATDSIRKSKLPEKQRGTTNQLIADAIEHVNRHLTSTPKPLSEDRGEDYAKWFRIISGDAGETKKGNLAAESASREADTKERKEVIRHLRIRDLLLSGPFKLNSSSPNTSRVITFLPDGVIGMGQTYLVARWRLSEGKLELLDMAGAVQSRFVLSSDGRFLTQVMDPTAPSARTSQLVHIATKS